MRFLRNSTLLLVPLGLLSAVIVSAQGFTPGGAIGAAAGEDWGSVLVDWTQNMITSFGGLFVQEGIYELAVFSALMVLWTIFMWGLNRALSFAHHAHYPFPFPQVAMVFLKTAILLYFLNHYMVAFPGVSFNFHSWPMAIAKHMTLQLDNGPLSAKEQLMTLLQSPSNLVDKPISPIAILDNFIYLNVIVWIGLVSFGMFVLGGLGYVMAGVFTVIGPYFIPLWLLGGRPAGWAWNWLQVMIAVASYRVFGSAMEYVMANMWITFLNNAMAGNTSVANWIAHGGICIGLSFFFLVAMTMVPVFAAQMFNGAGAMAQAGATALVGVASAAKKLMG